MCRPNLANKYSHRNTRQTISSSPQQYVITKIYHRSVNKFVVATFDNLYVKEKRKAQMNFCNYRNIGDKY